MNSLIKGLFIILIFRGSSGLSTSVVDSPLDVTNLIEEASKLNIAEYIGALNIEDGVLDLEALIQQWNITTDLKSMLSKLNLTVTDAGDLDLKTIFQNFTLSNINYSNVLSYVEEYVSTKALEYISLAETVISDINFTGYVTDYLNSLSVQSTVDGRLDFQGLAKKYTGAAEEYNVTTEDSYILKVFHIPSNQANSKVVLLSPPFLGSSDDFILRGKTSLVYALAQKGFDVWLINYRGNRYSRSHATLNPDNDTAFWNYSAQEFGYYDLSAVIDFVLNKTGRKQLSVVGHSEGNSAFFVLTSTRPEYNDKIETFIALSPVTYLSRSSVVLSTIISLEPVLNTALLASGTEELLGYESYTRKLIQLLCSQGTVGYNVCLKLGMGALSGFHSSNLEPEFFQSLLGHFPAGSSRKNLDHCLQFGKRNEFAQYDYGSCMNQKKYGTDTPPIYDLKKVTCNVILVLGANDKIFSLADGERLKSSLPNVRDYYVVDDKLFNHGDFIWGANASQVVYPYVIEKLNC